LAGGCTATAAALFWERHRYVEHYRSASEALVQRDFAAARMHLLLCLRSRPTDVPAHLLLARTERLAENYDDAERALNECRKLPASGDLLALEAILLRVQQGELADVKSLASRVEQNDPESEWILEAMSRGYQKAYRFADALGCLTRLIELRPNHFSAHLLRGQLLERFTHPTAAADDFRECIALNPKDDAARLCLGEALLNANNPNAAAEQFEALTNRLPDNAAVQLGLARARRGQGRLPDAEKLLRRLTALHPTEAPMWVDRGQVELQLGNHAEAEASLRQAVQLRPNDYQANFHLLQCLRGRASREAIQALEKHLSRIEGDVQHLDRVSKELWQAPYAPEKRCEAGLLCLDLSREEEARAWFESALRQDPRSALAYQGLARYYEQAGNSAAAERCRRLEIQARQSR
jgi:tetratricopeptide (TPR) repeat protein